MIMYIMLGACIVLLLVLIILTLTHSNGANSARLEELSRQMNELVNKNYEQQVKIMETLNDNNANQTKFIQQSIWSMQEGNEKKLEQMRETVDEKLTSTLNKRINASFEQVSTQLTNVYQSLGEMKELSSGVTGLNKILTNVKTRGTWAELQLDNILEQIIPNMYERNVKTNPKYNGQVEFAVKIPNADNDEISWLPIDSKFPMEDYIRLTDAPPGPPETAPFPGAGRESARLSFRSSCYLASTPAIVAAFFPPRNRRIVERHTFSRVILRSHPRCL